MQLSFAIFLFSFPRLFILDHLRSGNRIHVAFLYFCDIGKEIILQQRLINDVWLYFYHNVKKINFTTLIKWKIKSKERIMINLLMVFNEKNEIVFDIKKKNRKFVYTYWNKKIEWLYNFLHILMKICISEENGRDWSCSCLLQNHKTWINNIVHVIALIKFLIH